MSDSSNLASKETGSHSAEEAVCAQLTASIEDLRVAILALKPTGPSGFEGLLAKVLTKICGQDFRLAKSGFQNGKDGETLATASNHISFEAKLYKSKTLDDKDVHSKITSLIASPAPPDVWILGTTIGVSTQLLETIQPAVEKNGIGLLVLDWPDASTVPPLAAVCALAQEETCAFLRDHLDDTDCVKKAKAACAAIQKSDAFRVAAHPLIQELQGSSLAEANARRTNAKWHEDSLADQVLARARFGQVLAPNATGPLPFQKRTSLVKQVHQCLTHTSSPKIVALVGGEGHGKSWLAARSWLALGDRPILIMIPAADLKSAAASENFTPNLIAKLIQQTDENESDISRKRWERRLKQWKDQPNEASPRFILYVDGLNQQPAIDWPRWLDGVATDIDDIGGSLIITARESYFNERIRPAVLSGIATVHVPEWSAAELKEILAAKGNHDSKIKPTVFAKLRNPRILGIAFDLLEKGVIHDFRELSEARLLFERIRVGEREYIEAKPPMEFSKRLAQHAQTIIDRVKLQQIDDRLIFDRTDGKEGYTLSADLIAVTSEQFFRPLPEDPTLYTLADEGLSLALGIAIIKALQMAERNSRDVADALDELIEPIGALGITADAVFSAVMASSIDELCSSATRSALICGYLRLQNIDPQSYPAFVSVVRNSTDAAMRALFDISTTTFRYTANKDWLSMALRDCRGNPECWRLISAQVSDWLRSYSRDPKAGMMRYPEEVQADEIAKNIEEKIAELSAGERTFLEKNMLERAGYLPWQLWEEAFELLAGMPLADFAEQLVACSFSHALNSVLRDPYYDKYLALIRFNRADWQETRERLIRVSTFLTQSNTSSTGQWALVAILRGTSTVDDAEREKNLVDALTRDREKFDDLRLVEAFCSTDPCDPASVEPDDIGRTVERYRQVDVDERSPSLSWSTEECLVREMLPGLARFRPKVAIEIPRKFARSIVAREAPELKLGISLLEQYCAALDSETVRKLVDVANSLSVPCDLKSIGTRDDWIKSQYAILIAFPHLDGDTQLDILVGLPPHGSPLPELANVFKSATPEKLEYALHQAMQSGECNRALFALLFTRHSGTDLNDHSRILIGQFADQGHSSVRAEAMNIIVHMKDVDLIEHIATTNWSANLLDQRENYYEIWFGSLIVIEAAAQRAICVDGVLDRIIPSLYGEAAKVVGKVCHAEISSRLISVAKRVLEIDLPCPPPTVEKNIESVNPGFPPLLSLVSVKSILETPENFEANQQKRWEAFNRFETALTKEGARLIVEGVDIEVVDVCVSVSQERYVGFASELLRVDERKLAYIQNFALMLARSVSHHDLTLSCRLFDHLSGRRALVNFVAGPSKVPLEAICIWKSADGGPINDLRTYRLDHAGNDHQLAQEVLSALMAGKTKFLEEYARENLKSPIPVANARALMVIGFGAESFDSEVFLNKYLYASGLIGRAAKSARFAYDRNKWAKQWFDKMSNTDCAEEFWAFSVLFLKIVDARFDLWRGNCLGKGTAMPQFAPSIRSQFEKRIRAWEAKRNKTLFGEEAPGEVYM